MNNDWILFHLREAAEELSETIAEIEADSDGRVTEATFRSALEHVYHHVNFAWNSRNFTPKQAEDSSYEEFLELRQFPREVMPSTTDDDE